MPLLAKLRFVGLASSFLAGDYLFDIDTISLYGNQVTTNVSMLCFGDVNASFCSTHEKQLIFVVS